MIDDGTLKLSEVIGWLAAALTGLLTWAGKRQISRIDEHDNRLDKLDKGTVTRDDLTQTEVRITEAIRASSAHLAERLGDVKATADKAHERIDTLRDAAKEWRT